jgi:hypothetical protein
MREFKTNEAKHCLWLCIYHFTLQVTCTTIGRPSENPKPFSSKEQNSTVVFDSLHAWTHISRRILTT